MRFFYYKKLAGLVFFRCSERRQQRHQLKQNTTMQNTTIFGLSAVLAFSDVALIKYFEHTPTVWILLPLTLLAAWLMIQSASAK